MTYARGDDAAGSARGRPPVNAGFDAHLDAGGVAFDADDAALLEAVDERGSLNAAAGALGRSYSRAHERLAALEEAFGPLVERRRGGSGGGGSDLTDAARDLLARFERLRAEFTGTAEADETVLRGEVVERAGELATVRTAAGVVRALLPAAGEDVEVSVRSDAVTLNEPGDAPDDGATSARNRFAGEVVGVDRGEQVARVALDVGAETELTALVTTESVSRLALEPGARVVATFKATATRATPRDR